MKQFIYLIFFFSFFNAFTQNSIEELKTELQNSFGKERIVVQQKLASEYRYKLPVLSEKYARESIMEATNMRDTLLLIKGYRLMGGTKEFQAQYDSSVYYFQLSHELAVSINNDKEIAIANSNLAFFYIHSKEYKKAIAILEKNVPLFLKDHDTSNLAIIYNNIGTCFFKLNELDSALIYLEEASILKKMKDNQTSYGISLLNIAEVNTKKGDYETALKLLSQALDIFENKKSTYNISYTYILLADLFKKRQKLDQSSLYLKLALENANKIESTKLKSNIYKRLSDAYIESENYKKGHEFYLLYKQIDDSLTKISNTEMVNELKVAYEFDLLQERLVLTEEKLDLETSKNRYLILFVLVLFIFFIFILIQYRKMRKKNILLVEQRLTSKIIPKEPKAEISDDLKDLYKKIIFEMEQNELFTNADLNINELAELIGSNTTYVSKAINSISDKNFKSFINEFRVNKAIELLKNNTQEQYTMAAISEMAGFTSVSVFNRSFKENVGVTPSFFSEKSKRK